MKHIKKIFVTLLAVFLLVGCNMGSGNKSSKEIVTSVPAGTEITFWHAMTGAQEKALTQITKDFEAANPNIKVKLEDQSQYSDLQAKLNATMTSPSNLPTITQAVVNWLYNASKEDVLVDLKPFIEHKELGIKDISDVVPALMDGAKIEGTQFGIPFNVSTEVLYYNKALLDQYGVKVPTTMEELAQASKDIFEKSNGAVVGTGFDSLNNYYAIGMANAGIIFDDTLDVASQESLKVAQYFQDGVKEGYFTRPSRGEYLTKFFGAQKLAMNISSMAAESYIKKASTDFEFGIALRPAVKNIQHGTDIYMFDSATPEQKTAAFMYMKHLISNEAQLYWAAETGYMPVRQSVMSSEAYKVSGSKVAPIIDEASKNLFIIPVITNADPAFNLALDMMDEVLADTSVDAQTVLNSYKAKFESAWKQ